MDGNVDGIEPADGGPPSSAEILGLGAGRIAALLAEFAAADSRIAVRLQASLRNRSDIKSRAPQEGVATADERYLVGESAPMARVFREIRQFAVCDAPVLITGETGTGKELAARAIHERSRFAAGPFVPINCAGLPPTLISSELFGYEKGAFTGAVQRKIGRIEAANGGTVFLDEIGDLAIELQPHLLRFLQEGTIERLGGQHPVPVYARVVAATHRPLSRDVAHDRFREDLYYRLNVLRLHMPALRERGEDIELLAQFFAGRIGPALGRPGRVLSAEALAAVRAHPWPGNIRELISRIRRAVVTAEAECLGAADLGLSVVERRRAPRESHEGGAVVAAIARHKSEHSPPSKGTDGEVVPDNSFMLSLEWGKPCPPLVESRRRLEKWLILAALKQHGDNISVAADALGISRVTLYRLLEKHGVRVNASTQ